jgi:phasin family protein
MNPAEQMMDLHKSTLATLTDVSVTTLTAVERLIALHINSLHQLLDGSLENTKNLSNNKDPAEAMKVLSGIQAPMINAAMGYSSEAMQIVQTTTTAMSQIFDQYWRGGATRMSALAEGFSSEAGSATNQFSWMSQAGENTGGTHPNGHSARHGTGARGTRAASASRAG